MQNQKPKMNPPTAGWLLPSLNTGKPVGCVVNLYPSDYVSQQTYLLLSNLPENEFANTVLVVKLEF